MQLERNDTMRKIVMLLLVVIISSTALIMNKGTNIKKVEDNKSQNEQIACLNNLCLKFSTKKYFIAWFYPKKFSCRIYNTEKWIKSYLFWIKINFLLNYMF